MTISQQTNTTAIYLYNYHTIEMKSRVREHLFQQILLYMCTYTELIHQIHRVQQCSESHRFATNYEPSMLNINTNTWGMAILITWCNVARVFPSVYWNNFKKLSLKLHISCTECCSTTRKVFTTALYCYHWSYFPGKAGNAEQLHDWHWTWLWNLKVVISQRKGRQIMTYLHVGIYTSKNKV